MLQSIEAILFDFDGVILNSLDDHLRSWNATFKPHNVEIDCEELALLEGQSLYTIGDQLCRQHGIDSSKSLAIAQSKNKLYHETASIEYYPGVEQVLRCTARRGLKRGLVTGAHKDRVQVSVKGDIEALFDIVVTADDVDQTKPHPEPFLKAATLLKREYSRCMVVENAPLGIKAAKAAGMYCIAVTSTLSRKYLMEADDIIDRLTDLIDILNCGGESS